MENYKKIAHNTLWQIIGRLVGTFFGVVTIGLLTRYLGQENFGYYTTAVAFMQFFGTILDMGLYLICLKEISAHPEKESYILSNVFSLRLLSSVIFMGGATLLILAFPYPPVVKMAGAITSLSFLLVSLIQIITSAFQKYFKMGQVALAEAIGRLVFLLSVIVFIYYQTSLPAMMWANVFNPVVYFLILWFLLRKLVKIHWRADIGYWKSILHKAWPIGLGVVLNLVYFRADTIILSLYRPAFEVGIYGAPYKILEIITTFPHMFMGLVMPLLTAAWLAGNVDKFKVGVQKTFDFFVSLAVPMVLGTLPIAGRIMKLVAGADFVVSGPILVILMLATGIIFLGVLLTYTLVILDKQKAMLKYFFMAAVFSLIGYFIFIPRYSYFGAAWVTVVIETFIVITSALIFYQTTKIKLNLKIFSRSLLASVIMLGVLSCLDSWPIIWLIFLAVLIYGLIMIITGGWNKKSFDTFEHTN